MHKQRSTNNEIVRPEVGHIVADIKDGNLYIIDIYAHWVFMGVLKTKHTRVLNREVQKYSTLMKRYGHTIKTMSQ